MSAAETAAISIAAVYLLILATKAVLAARYRRHFPASEPSRGEGVAIAQAILVLQITDSKVALGTVTMLQFLPITLLVLFAGMLADRAPKRELMSKIQPLL